MKDVITKVLYAFTGSLLVGAFLFFISGKPPYGLPNNELSNNYWGLIIDIAHQWRSLQFSFWNVIGGGTSLFSSGQYPILNPTNSLAWLLNDDQFYLFKLIEPYMLGFFSMAFLLLHIFKLPVAYAFSGALYFLGLPFIRGTNSMVESPTFLYGFFLFPTMVHGYLFFYRQSVTKAMAWVGVMLAVIFMGCGVILLPQLLVWWSICCIGHQLVVTQGFKNQLRNSVCGIGVMAAMMIGVAGVQFIPTILFSKLEGARLIGHYGINNFPLFGDNSSGFTLMDLWNLFFVERQRMSALFVISLGLFVAMAALVRLRHIPLLYVQWAVVMLGALAVYVLIPHICWYLSSLLPWLQGMFKPLTLFTFRYGAHIIDFMIIIVFILMIGFKGPAVFVQSDNKYKNMVGYIVDTLICAVLACVVIVISIFVGDDSLRPILWVWVFHAAEKFYFIGSFLAGAILIGLHAGYGRFYWGKWLAIFLLITIGFVSMWRCYNFNEKGKTGDLQLYGIGTPEFNFYSKASGQYFIPFDHCRSMHHNFPLGYGVYSTDAFLPVPAYRFSKFLSTYHSDKFYTSTKWAAPQLMLRQPASAIATRFPVDFTVIFKDQPLGWKNFDKTISGEYCDVWQRNTATPHLRFAHSVISLPYDHLIEQFDKPFQGDLFIDADDVIKFNVSDYLGENPKNSDARYVNWKQESLGHLRVDIETPQDVFVIFPYMFQQGWSLTINGKPGKIFPAEYIFIGFKVPAGSHHIVLKFVPPGLYVGLILMLLSWIGLFKLYFKKAA